MAVFISTVYWYILSECAETSIRSESKTVKGLRRERRLSHVCMVLWRIIILQRRAVIVLQKAAKNRLCVSTEFYYISLAFHSTVAVMHGGMYVFISLL